jgi:GntR family transcriptional repressor for pyruvate dehydrogenase complex
MTLAPARRTRLAEHVAEQIIDLVKQQALRPGERLPTESELMERMEVGRSTVREALRGLAVLGLLEIRQGQGTFVKAPPASDGTTSMAAIFTALSRGLTEELLEARAIIEVRMTALAARRATAEDLAALDRVVEESRGAIAAGLSCAALSAQFHLCVARAAHNDVLEGFVASYIDLLRERGQYLERLPGYLEWEVREHDAIRVAIASSNARHAAACMRNHLRDMTIHFEHLAAAMARPLAERRRGRAAVGLAGGADE